MNKKIALLSIAATLLLTNCVEGMKKSNPTIDICFYETYNDSIFWTLEKRPPSSCGFVLAKDTRTDELRALIEGICEYDYGHKLIYLCEIGCRHINLNEFISKDFPHLEKLEMFYTKKRGQFLKNIIKNTRLTYLRLDRHCETDLQDINWKKAQHLQTLVFNISNMNITHIENILKQVPNLKYLYLSGNSNECNPKQITYLDTRYKKCKIKHNPQYIAGPFAQEKNSYGEQ